MVLMYNTNGILEVEGLSNCRCIGETETYRTTSGPVYANPHRHSLALYGSYPYQINPKWTTILGLRYTDIMTREESTC